jgi:hypothetical protein
MSKKHKLRDDLKPEDCVTPELKLEYSRQMQRRWDKLEINKPSDLMKIPVETQPWHSPEFSWAHDRAQRERLRQQRRLARDQR